MARLWGAGGGGAPYREKPSEPRGRRLKPARAPSGTRVLSSARAVRDCDTALRHHSPQAPAPPAGRAGAGRTRLVEGMRRQSSSTRNPQAEPTSLMKSRYPRY